jgi:hypothetical protein
MLRPQKGLAACPPIIRQLQKYVLVQLTNLARLIHRLHNLAQVEVVKKKKKKTIPPQLEYICIRYHNRFHRALDVRMLGLGKPQAYHIRFCLTCMYVCMYDRSIVHYYMI